MTVGPEPQEARAVLGNINDHRLCSDAGSRDSYLPSFAVNPVQPFIATHPERSLRIFENRTDEFLAQAVRIISSVLEDLERRLIG